MRLPLTVHNNASVPDVGRGSMVRATLPQMFSALSKDLVVSGFPVTAPVSLLIKDAMSSVIVLEHCLISGKSGLDQCCCFAQLYCICSRPYE